VANGQPSSIPAEITVTGGLPAQFSNSLTWLDDIGQPDAEFFIDYHDLTLCDEIAIDQHVHWFAGETIQLGTEPIASWSALSQFWAPSFTSVDQISIIISMSFWICVCHC
jgi:hypothetical protein